ncbi:MAG TPA: neutral zinc metallopeptidase, partial [Candidatus Eisenbacteria bacterium]|nr:neutral zinc metallopeptidase [Candidatus Eisenbacteria bacterium]
EGDIEEGLNAAAQIGDDRIQKRTQGYVVPDSFTHGSAKQRVQWFRRGISQGDINQCDTFSADAAV